LRGVTVRICGVSRVSLHWKIMPQVGLVS
jgi:hypothetical protein